MDETNSANDVIIEGNFLGDYMEYCDITESPKIYDLWSALACLSAIVSKRVWIDQGHFNVYANLYTVLVGGPGQRKTTAMNVAKDIVRKLKTVPFAGTCMTKEAVCLDMKKNCIKQFTNPVTGAIQEYTPYALILTELSHFLAINPAFMIDFLTTIYDQEHYETKTKNKGDDIIPGPYIVLLACTTPNNIQRYLKEDVIGGGFSRRCLFIWSDDDGEPKAFPQETQSSRDAMARCLDYGERLLSVKGMFKWEDSARSFYEDWYNSLHRSLRSHNDPTTIGYYKSKHVQLLKVAMLFALSKSTDLVLRTEHLQVGLEQLGLVEANLSRVFEGMGRNVLNAVKAKLLDMIRRAGTPLYEKFIKATMYGDANSMEIAEVLTNLTGSDQISILEEKEPNSGALIRRWFAVPEVAKDWATRPSSEFISLFTKLRSHANTQNPGVAAGHVPPTSSGEQSCDSPTPEPGQSSS